MTFDDVLAQAIELLQRQGRVSYGALKRRFDLDDAYLDDLKDELIEAQRLAVDEDGRVLVWIGSASAPPVPSATPLAESRPSEAERRQLTVMFCDLVDSTPLSGQLDPEDLLEVIQAYQGACAVVIQRFEGHIAQHLGDGLLVYFGYPQAHEDDAQRAVRTGLDLLEAMGTLNCRLVQEKGVRLAIRVGIHTGLVVIGAMGGEGRQEQLALGETPTIAARLQTLAMPDTVAMSEATSRLVHGYFACQPLGMQHLPDLARPLAVYRVLRESGAQSRLDVAHPRALTPMVGREQEVRLLLERWSQVQDGMGQIVLVSGEAGIGKSRLVQVIKDHIADEPHTQLECRCSPYYHNTALYPIIDLLERLLQFQRDEAPAVKLEKLERALSQYRLALDDTVPLFATFLSLPLSEERYQPLTLTPQRQKQKTLEALLVIVLELAERHPVFLIIEDLHWVDPSTLEFLTLLIEQGPIAPILTVLTCRPEFPAPWGLRTHLTPLALQRLPRAQARVMVERVTGGKSLPPEITQQVVAKTDGVPLFVEELTKMVLESGLLRETQDHYELTGPLPPLAIPTTLHDSLMARLDRLATVKVVAQLGATLGRMFAYDLLQVVASLDEATLQHGLRQLVEAELLYQRGVPPQATYLFKHALIQEAAYQSLLKSTRQQYHQRVAQVLEARFPKIAETQPELVAHHYTEAGSAAQALPHWQRAAERATARSAYVEAIGHVTAGLAALAALSDTPERRLRELDLQVALGAALTANKGFAAAEAGQAYTRARELSRQVADTPQLAPVLLGLWVYYHVRAELQTAHEIGEELLRLAHRWQDPLLLNQAHHALGITSTDLGAFPEALDHLEQAVALYTPAQHRAHIALSVYDTGAVCRAFAAHNLWYLGYPDQAEQRNHEALALAQELAHPYSSGGTLCLATLFASLRHEWHRAKEWTETVITLSREQGFPYFLAWGTTLWGWALSTQGQSSEGITQLQQGLAAYRTTGAAVLQTYWCALLAEALSKAGQAEAGLRVLDEALTTIHNSGEHRSEAELHRLRGELLLSLSADNHTEAEGCFHQALSIARHQQAKSLELRAATSLSRLWQQQGKCVEAQQLLAEVYAWFTEGLDTADLQEAKALLEEWG